MTDAWPDPARPGVPLNPELRGWHWLYLYNGIPSPAYWDDFWLIKGHAIKPEELNPNLKYWQECLTPAEVDARVAEARRAGLEEAVKWHEERALKLGQEASLARNFRQLLGKSDFHLCSAAAIRALEGKKND